MEHLSEVHRVLAATLLQDIQIQLQELSEEAKIATESYDGPECSVGKLRHSWPIYSR